MIKAQKVKKGDVIVIVVDKSTKKVVVGEKKELVDVPTSRYILGRPYTVITIHLPFIVVDYPSTMNDKRYSSILDSRDIELDLCSKEYELAAGKV